jgi:hypothetical protein
MFAVQPKSYAEFDQYGSEYANDINQARDIAFDWSVSEGGKPMTIWRLSGVKPVRWMNVEA